MWENTHVETNSMIQMLYSPVDYSKTYDSIDGGRRYSRAKANIGLSNNVSTSHTRRKNCVKRPTLWKIENCPSYKELRLWGELQMQQVDQRSRSRVAGLSLLPESSWSKFQRHNSLLHQKRESSKWDTWGWSGNEGSYLVVCWAGLVVSLEEHLLQK